MNNGILKFTLLSACLDKIKLSYIILLGFVVPIGMKLVTYMHGAEESQTFEMLTGKVGVAFIMTGLCLGLAGGGSGSQTGKGSEYLPLILTRPITRAEYIITKWATFTLVGGVLAAVQNLIVALIGIAFGEILSPYVVAGQMLERFLDAGIIAAALTLALVAQHWIFQIFAIGAFYVWMMAQTMPPVSVAGPSGAGVDAVALEGTHLMLTLSRLIGELILPTISVYDAANAPHFPYLAIISYVSTIVIYLVAAIAVINKREFFYGTSG
jgi:hypothetical protein